MDNAEVETTVEVASETSRLVITVANVTAEVANGTDTARMASVKTRVATGRDTAEVAAGTVDEVAKVTAEVASGTVGETAGLASETSIVLEPLSQGY